MAKKIQNLCGYTIKYETAETIIDVMGQPHKNPTYGTYSVWWDGRCMEDRMTYLQALAYALSLDDIEIKVCHVVYPTYGNVHAMPYGTAIVSNGIVSKKVKFGTSDTSPYVTGFHFNRTMYLLADPFCKTVELDKTKTIEFHKKAGAV